MSSSTLKTYLINDNGEYKIKEHMVKDKLVVKNTFQDKKTQMKMAKLARTAKENSHNLHHSHNKSQQHHQQHHQHHQPQQHPQVVHVNVVQKSEPTTTTTPMPKPIPMEKVIYLPAQPTQQVKIPHCDEANLEDIKKKIQKESDFILKNNNKETKEDEKQKNLLAKICKIIGIQGHPHGKLIPFDTLNDPHIIKELFALQDTLKEVFPSSKLTALHSNAIDKQQFPGVNIVRQIFKEMGYRLKSINISDGYLGTKKLLRREYQILKI